MEKPFYPFDASEDKLLYTFESIGGKATVQKVVVYSPMNRPDFYNLALLDETADGTTSDLTVTDNKDMERVLATVYQILLLFLKEYPSSRVFFTGSTPARTRLYRIAINREPIKASELLLVQGYINAIFEDFVPNRDYEAFLISKK